MLNLCLIWHILRSYCFVAEITLTFTKTLLCVVQYLVISHKTKARCFFVSLKELVRRLQTANIELLMYPLLSKLLHVLKLSVLRKLGVLDKYFRIPNLLKKCLLSRNFNTNSLSNTLDITRDKYSWVGFT